MRISSIISEVMRNITAGASRAALWFLAVLMVGLLTGGAEAYAIIDQEWEASDRIAASADVMVMSTRSASIDGAVCDRLAGTNAGPMMSGALRPGPQVTPRSTPGRDITSYEVTSGLLAILASQSVGTAGMAGAVMAATTGPADPTGVWIPVELARRLGLSRGSRFETTAGDVTVAGVYAWPNDGRDTRLAYAVVVPVSSDSAPFMECWVRQWPASATPDLLLNATVIASGATAAGGADASSGQQQTPAGITPLNRSYDRRYNANASYRGRPTRFMPALAIGAGMIIGVVSTRRRRLEYAAALHSGQHKADQLLGVALEAVVWAGLATVCALAVLLAACARLVPSDAAAVMLAAARSPVMTGVSSLVASMGSAALIRESRLFRYFKKR